MEFYKCKTFMNAIEEAVFSLLIKDFNIEAEICIQAYTGLSMVNLNQSIFKQAFYNGGESCN